MVAPGAMAYAGGMNSSSRFTVLALLLTASLLALATTGCQTSKGFGKDVEKLGDKIQEKSS
jgi:predicted small secreted protein